jgi:hypothetical protein
MLKAILKAVSQSLIPKSDFLLSKLKSYNKNKEKIKAPKIALALIAPLLNCLNILANSKPINPNNDINKNAAKPFFSEKE